MNFNLNVLPRGVSICIPAFKPRYFRQALRSALYQNYSGNMEVIVSDDCPDDSIRAICAEFKDPRLHYTVNPRPRLLGSNIQNLIELTSFQYLKFLFDDDLLHPDCLSSLVTAIESDPSSVLSFSIRTLIDPKNSILGTPNPLGLKGLCRIESKQVVRLMAQNIYNPIGEFSTVLLSTSALKQSIGGRPWNVLGEIEWRGLGDVATWIRLSSFGTFVGVSRVLSYFRKHPQSNSTWEANKELIYGYTDWELVLVESFERNIIFELDEIKRAIEKLIRIYEASRSMQLIERAKELSTNLETCKTVGETIEFMKKNRYGIKLTSGPK
jgi:glycosyltransferase involved in cell wall biosynthesis